MSYCAILCVRVPECDPIIISQTYKVQAYIAVENTFHIPSLVFLASREPQNERCSAKHTNGLFSYARSRNACVLIHTTTFIVIHIHHSISPCDVHVHCKGPSGSSMKWEINRKCICLIQNGRHRSRLTVASTAVVVVVVWSFSSSSFCSYYVCAVFAADCSL